MEFVWNNGGFAWIIELVLVLILYVLGMALFYKVIKRKSTYIFYSIIFAFIIVSFLLKLNGVLAVSCAILAAGSAIILFANLGDLRAFIANPFKRATAKSGKGTVEKFYDRDTVSKVLYDAAISLSKTKTGALITIERSNDLKDFYKNGVIVDAPVSVELLNTIFYPGTRLHDGAVIIKGDKIAAASCFYTPSTKAFSGKYGSRHRAAIGISEVSDAVTIVVSEETGRISIAVDGQLNAVSTEGLTRALSNYLNTNDDN